MRLKSYIAPCGPLQTIIARVTFVSSSDIKSARAAVVKVDKLADDLLKAKPYDSVVDDIFDKLERKSE